MVTLTRNRKCVGLLVALGLLCLAQYLWLVKDTRVKVAWSERQKGSNMKGSKMIQLEVGELPGDDWTCKTRGNSELREQVTKWLTSHAKEGRRRILFIGDSVTMQYPRSILCALPLNNQVTVGNVRRFKGLLPSDDMASVRSRGVSPWYNDEGVAPPPWPKVPFAEDWYLSACNCTIGHALTYTILTEGDRNPQSMSLAAMEVLLEEYDLVIFGMGYHFHRNRKHDLAAVFEMVTTLLLGWMKKATNRKAMLFELFPQHFQGPNGLFQDKTGWGCRPFFSYDEFVANGGNWRNDVIRNHTKSLPLIPTVEMTLPWSYLKVGEPDCTHWHPNAEVVRPLIESSMDIQ